VTAVASELGLRERKKQQTRLRIAEAARRLFFERGFDTVSVAEVAREADVSVGTVFNYFPTKEDLFYSGMDDFVVRLLDAVRERPAGEPVLPAFRRVLMEGIPRLASDDTTELIASATRIINSSRSLQARELEIVSRSTDELAALLADEIGRPRGDVEAAAVAAALMGAQRALVAYVHDSVVRGGRGSKLVADARAQTRRAFARLDAGLGDFGASDARRSR
jgi:AcrR family transcriptional regulator